MSSTSGWTKAEGVWQRTSPTNATNGKAAQNSQYEKDWVFVQKIMQLVNEKLTPMAQRDKPPLKFKSPEDVKKELDLALESGNSKYTVDKLAGLCSDMIDLSVKTGSPLFYQVFYHGVDPFGMAATILIEALNTSMYTFDVGPVVTLVEMEVIKKLTTLVGWPNGDGIHIPGGSTGNMYAANLARYTFDKTIKTQGLVGQKRFLIYTSDANHFSVLKATAFMGFGTDSIVVIKTDKYGAIDCAELESKIIEAKMDESCHPLMVWAHSGTTIFNGFDDLSTIADICKRHKIWAHTDACLGGCTFLSRKYRHLVNGIEKMDSLSWCWHKVLGAPFQTSVFLTKHKGLLREVHGTKAPYLYQSKKHYDTAYDLGDMSVQCGRKADALKVWMIWKARGQTELGRLVDTVFDSAQLLAGRMQSLPNFKLVIGQAQGPSVCFWVIPPSLQNVPEDEDFWRKLEPIALTLKGRMVSQGIAMIANQPLPEKGLVNFYRVTLGCHPLITADDADKLVEMLIELSADL